MRVLIIKTSSLGDIIHTLPAITDACAAHPGIQFDWVCEENFVEIASWHPAVKHVWPVALRRWRKKIGARSTRQEWKHCRQQLAAQSYDYIIDAQGLLKSAWLSRYASGQRVGFNRQSVREPLASLFYHRKIAVAKEQHAITRLRQLFAAALDYPLPETIPDYGIDRQRFCRGVSTPYLFFLHGTTWPTKHWPEPYWVELAEIAGQQGISVKLTWGNEEEKARAERIAKVGNHVVVLPRLKLVEIASVLAEASAIVAVDTGLGHLSAMLNVPTVSLYGPTNPVLTGALGANQVHLSPQQFRCSPCLTKACVYQPPSPLKFSPLKPPCFTTLPPKLVWDTVATFL